MTKVINPFLARIHHTGRICKVDINKDEKQTRGTKSVQKIKTGQKDVLHAALSSKKHPMPHQMHDSFQIAISPGSNAVLFISDAITA